MQRQETFHEALGQPRYPPFLQLNDEGTQSFFTKEAFFSPSKRLQVFPGHDGRVGDLSDPPEPICHWTSVHTCLSSFCASASYARNASLSLLLLPFLA